MKVDSGNTIQVGSTSGRILYPYPGGVVKFEASHIPGGTWTHEMAPLKPGETFVDASGDERRWLLSAAQGLIVLDTSTQQRAHVPETESAGFPQLSEDGSRLLWLTEDGGGTVVLELSGAPKKFLLKTPSVTCAKFSTDDRWVVARERKGWTTWKVGSWEPGPSFQSNCPQHGNAHFHFSRDGSTIVLRSSIDTLRLHDIASGRLLLELATPVADFQISSFAFDANLTKLWLLSPGNRMFVWDLQRVREGLAKIQFQYP
jgi:WD40 repeat protein